MANLSIFLLASLFALSKGVLIGQYVNPFVPTVKDLETITPVKFGNNNENTGVIILASMNPDVKYECTNSFSLQNTETKDLLKSIISQFKQDNKADKYYLSLGGSSFSYHDFNKLAEDYVSPTPTPGESNEDPCTCALYGNVWYPVTNTESFCAGTYVDPIKDGYVNVTDGRTHCEFLCCTPLMEDYCDPQKYPGSEGVYLPDLVLSYNPTTQKIPASLCDGDLWYPNGETKCLDFSHSNFISLLCDKNQPLYNPPQPPTFNPKVCPNVTEQSTIEILKDYLDYIGADGVELDFESLNPAYDTTAEALTGWSKAFRDQYGNNPKPDVLVTILASSLWVKPYQPIIDCYKATQCDSFTHLVIMPYANTLYPYNPDDGNAGSASSGDCSDNSCSWNGLVNYWYNYELGTKENDMKFLTALIANAQGPSAGPDDLFYLDNFYFRNPAKNSVPVNGVFFWWFSPGFTLYNPDQLAALIKTCIDCFGRNKPCSHDEYKTKYQTYLPVHLLAFHYEDTVSRTSSTTAETDATPPFYNNQVYNNEEFLGEVRIIISPKNKNKAIEFNTEDSGLYIFNNFLFGTTSYKHSNCNTTTNLPINKGTHYMGRLTHALGKYPCLDWDDDKVNNFQITEEQKYTYALAQVQGFMPSILRGEDPILKNWCRNAEAPEWQLLAPWCFYEDDNEIKRAPCIVCGNEAIEWAKTHGSTPTSATSEVATSTTPTSATSKVATSTTPTSAGFTVITSTNTLTIKSTSEKSDITNEKKKGLSDKDIIIISVVSGCFGIILVVLGVYVHFTRLNRYEKLTRTKTYLR